MALICCPECAKEVSNKANSCPNCGFPLQDNAVDLEQNQLFCPTFPNNLDIGSHIVNWGGDAVVSGELDANENTMEGLGTGPASIMLHKKGISVHGRLYKHLLDIHFTQLISIKKTDSQELQQIDKSVIGRAAIGGLILGPLGAVIGGMSGIGTKSKHQNINYLAVNYWNIETKKPMTILFRAKDKVEGFIKRCEKEESRNLD